jgi:hypothetical protein
MSLRRKIDLMYIRTIPNMLDHMQERSWSPQKVVFKNGFWKYDSELQFHVI